MITRPLLSFLFLLLMSVAVLAQDTSPEEKHVLLRLYADKTAAVPGQTVRLAIEQTISPGWHTYWTNPGDSGEAMKIDWTLPKGYETTDLVWPAPERIPYGPLMNFGYSDHAVILTNLTVPASATPGQTITIKGDATILVCDEICIPESHSVELTLPVSTTADAANESRFADAASRLPLMLDWKTITEYNADDVRVRITLPASEAGLGDAAHDMIWFPLEWGYIENATDQMATYESSTRTLTLRQAAASDRDISKLDNVQYLVRTADAAFIVGGPIKPGTAPTMFESEPMVEIATATLPLIFLFAFLGGVILNIMPCVFPVLSMKALHLVSLPRDERNHARLHGLLYAAGIIVMFLVLAALLFALRSAGQQLGWGFQLQNPALVAGIAWLMFVIGLNLAGVFDLRIAFGGEMLLAERHHPLVTSFLTGVLATLVATPCSAPFMATAVGAALVQPMGVSLGIFAMVGVGLAFPYLLLCFVPALQRLLPRPGAWMQTFRQVLAFPMFATAVWLVWVVAQQGGSQAVAGTLAGMVALAFAIWLIDREPKKILTRRFLTLSGVLIIVATIWSLSTIIPVQEQNAAREEAGAVNHQPYDQQALEQLLRDTNQPVFVNMTAAWCITCLVNEKVVLSTPEAQTLFAQHDVVYLKGDWTNRDESITAFLQHYGRSGVPIYVYYGPRDSSGVRPAGKVLPQILSIEELQSLFADQTEEGTLE